MSRWRVLGFSEVHFELEVDAESAEEAIEKAHEQFGGICAVGTDGVVVNDYERDTVEHSGPFVVTARNGRIVGVGDEYAFNEAEAVRS